MEEITVKQFLNIIKKSDRLRIQNEAGKDLFIGWVSLYPGQYDEAAVKTFRSSPELRVKDWQQKELMAPIEPNSAPEYRFSDLDMKLYLTLTIKEKEI